MAGLFHTINKQVINLIPLQTLQLRLHILQIMPHNAWKKASSQTHYNKRREFEGDSFAPWKSRISSSNLFRWINNSQAVKCLRMPMFLNNIITSKECIVNTMNKFYRFWSPSIAFFHCHALCFASSNDKTFFGMQILKCEGVVTWMLRSLGLSDQIIFPFTISLEGST